MALKGVESWDIYGTSDITNYWQTAGTSSIVASQGRCSSAALYNATVGGDGPSIGVSTSQLGGFVAFAYNPGSLTAQSDCLRILNLAGDSILVATINADGSLSWWSGPNTTLGTRMVTTPAGLLNVGTYDHVGFDFYVNGGSSYLKIFVNAVQQAAYSGSITFGGFAPSDKAWRAFQLVHPSGGYIDDVYWGDTDVSDVTNPYASTAALGDCRVEGQLPLTDASGGGGNYREWTCSTGTDHGALLDENPPNQNTDYVWSDTLNQRETVKYPAITLGYGTVYAVQSMPNAEKTAAGSRSIANFLYRAGNSAAGTTQALSEGAYRYLPQLYTKDPTDSSSFTATTVDALECGVELIV